MSDREIEVIRWFLDRADRAERAFIAGMAMAAALETYPPEEREAALDRAVAQFRDRLAELPH